MVVRLRVRHPNGTHQLQAEDGWTPAQLADRIRTDLGISHFSLKTADFPPAVIDLDSQAETLAGLKLNGSVLTLTPTEPPEDADARARSEQEARDAFMTAELAAADSDTLVSKASDGDSKNLSVPWPEMEGSMLLRVMADDNSCLFTALSAALVPGVPDPAPYLRNQIAEYILSHPETYNKATLDKEPAQYTRNLRGKDFWGGSIEMSVLSHIFDIEITAVDVKTGQAFPHGENKSERCLVLYSGIHYDRIVFTPALEYPPDTDVTRFPISDPSPVERAKLLADQLRRSGYFTDTNTMVLRCEVPGCDWYGDMKMAQDHIKATTHQDFGEIPDTSN